MSRVSFHVEWQDAPGVRDPVLAQTWGRLTLKVDGHVVTRALDLRANSARDGVYGPMFPLAEWLVENFWFITNEIPRANSLSGRFAPHTLHAWMLRHNLLSAGAGAALPDLTFASDGDGSVVALWFPDSTRISERRTVRFLGDGRVVLSVREVEQAITAFTNAVLAKIEGLEHEEVARLRRDWQAVGDSMREEETLCRNLAKLGLDPYGVEDEQIDRLEGALAAIPPSLRSDLLDSDNLEGLAASAGYAERSSRLVAQGRGPAFHASLVVPPRSSVPAHEVGYRVAHDFRKAVGIAHDRGVADLQGLLEQHAAAVRAETLPGPDGTRVKGVVGFAPTTRAAVLVTPRERPPTTLRFLLGRALGACLLGQCDQGPRLLTDALTWEQAATRAFSAELLAPQAALAQRVRAEVSSDEVQKLAQEFEVSQLLIEHQIENHQLARVVPD